MKAVAYDATVDQWITEDGSRVNGSDAGKVALELPAVCDHRYVTHIIQMPQGYSKPVSTRCDKCGHIQGYDNRVNGGTMNPYDQMQARTTAQLSAQERSKLTDAIIAQVGELTRQVNALTTTANEHERRTVGLAYDAADRLLALEREINATNRRVAVFTTRSFSARLRGLLTGR